MRNIFSLRQLFLLLPLLLLSVLAQATHFRYGSITWRTVTTDATKRTVQIKVSESFRRSFFSGNIVVGSVVNNADFLYFGDVSGAGTNINLTVTSVDLANDNFYGEFVVTHTYPSATGYTAYTNSSARLTALVNNGGASWHDQTLVNAGTGNNSPVSTLPPVVNLATGLPAATFQLPANDPDGDALSYSLPTSADVGGNAFTNAPGLTINATTGAITFPTSGKTVGALYNAVVKVSDGKTSVMVDFIIQITKASTPPAFDYSLTPSNGYVYQVAPGTAVNFSVRATDSDPGDVVTLKAVGLPSGSSMAPALPTNGNPVTSAFSWTPTASSLGTYVLTFVAQDAVGVQTNTSVTIQVSTKPTFDVPPTPSNGTILQIQPGTQITQAIQASNADPATLVRIISATGLASATYSPALPTAAGNPTSTQLSWTPVISNWGLNTVTFTAQNTNSSDQSTHQLQYVVNSPPSFTSTPAPASLNVVAGQPFSYSIGLTDPDLPYGDQLEIEDQNLPAWLTLTDNGNGTGTLSGTPAVSDAGNNLVTLVAADLYHHGASYGLITQQFTINVIPCSVQAHATPLTLVLDANGAATLTTAQFNNGSTATCGIASLTLSQSAFSCANYGANPVTLTVTDTYGNTSTDTQTVLVTDNTAPTAVAQNVTLYLDANGQANITAAQVNNGSSDNCGPVTLSIQPGQGVLSAIVQEHGTLTLTAPAGATFTAVNFASYGDGTYSNGSFQYGNCHAYYSQQIVESYLLGQNSASIPAENGLFGDPCDGTFKRLLVQATYTYANVPQATYTCANVGQPNPVTLTVTDSYGNVSTATANVTVLDAIAPTAVAQNVTVQLDASGNAAITAAQVDNGSADNCGVASVLVAPAAFTCANVGPNPVTLTVTDTHGNVSTATATVTVQDNIVPTAVAQNLTVQLNASGNATIAAAQVDNGSADNCGSVSLAVSPSAFTCANTGANTVTLTVTDTHGNVSTTTAVVTVEDHVAPAAMAKNLTVQLNASGAATITAAQVDNGSSDACGVASVVVSPSTFTCANVGPNPVTLTVTDTHGNVSTATATVTVVDGIAPVAVAKNITVQLNASGTATIAASQVNNNSTDNCGIASVAVAPSTFTCANYGANTVTLTVKDTNGNVSTTTAIVTVEDRVAPVALAKNLTVPLNASGAATITAAQVDNGSNDNCGIASVVVSPSTFTCANVGPNPVTLTVTDTHGNVSTATATVTVTDLTAPTAIAQNLTVQLNANGQATVTAAQVNNGSFDNCGVASVAVAPSTFTCANYGANTVTLTVTDTRGNVSTTTATVTVADRVAPVAMAKNLTVPLNASGSATITAAQVDNGSSDACGIASVVVSPSTFTCANYGANTVTLTVTDIHGNVSTTTAVVTVTDVTAPTAVAKNITVPLSATGTATITAAQVDNGSSDACGIASVVVSPSTFTCSNFGANTVTLTVTDSHGNVSTTTATVMVTDVTAPTVVTQNLTVNLSASGTASITAAQINNGSSDACGITSVVVSPMNFTCTNAGANTVTLTVTDSHGNVGTATAIVTVRDNIAPTLSACPANIVLTAAANDCTPVVTWTAPVGADNCSFVLTSTAASGSRFPVGNTTVTYTATDASGNKATCSFTVTVKASPVTVTLSSPTYSGGVNVACNGGTSGSATATVLGGCQPYRYLWSNGQTTATAKSLAAGTYSVTVTDVNNTSVTQRITLTQPTAPVVVSTSYSPQFTCTGGQTSTIYLGYGLQYLTLTASATGGTGAYSYNWSPATGLNHTNTACVVASPQVTTVYTVTATDANGCTSSKQFTVYVYNLFCGPLGLNIAMCNNGHELCVPPLLVPAQLLLGSTLGSCTYGNGRSTEAPAATSASITLVEKLTVEAFPNPSDGAFRVRVQTPTTGNTKVLLYDLQGRLVGTVFEGELQAREPRELTVDMPGLAAGTYLLRVQSGASTENLRLTVQR